jgi:hypothetical protein
MTMFRRFKLPGKIHTPFTLGALYKLRSNYLRIGYDRKLTINFDVPRKEDLYAKRDKLSYVVGNRDADLKISRTYTIARANVASMRNSTEIRVVKPQASWEKVISKLV